MSHIIKTKFHWMLLGVVLLLSILPTVAQNGAQITSYTTPYTEVGRSALETRTARIPVSWTTVNRPLTANLVFEQVLQDGSTINVELPRVIPWVASNGDGIAAPILPETNATSITLRVSLIDLFSSGVYDSVDIIIPVVNGSSGGDGSSSVAALIAFDAEYSTSISRSELENGTVRLPVSWQAINRPTWMNLVFEQVLPDGSIENVELPRSNPWVNSADRGMIAPIGVGTAPSQIVLRVRLVSFFEDRTYDQFYTYVPIQSTQGAPEITRFTSRIGAIASDGVAGNSLIDVTWTVVNRPNNSNVVFEQIMPDGSLRNVELPRDNQILPSAGEGVIDPLLPAESVANLEFQIRLIDLSNNNTLDTARLTIGLTEYATNNRVVVTGDACYQTPFLDSVNITNGAEVRVQRFHSGEDLRIFADPDDYTNPVTSVPAGTLLVVKADPHCSYVFENENSENRYWFVEGDGFQGWVLEYTRISEHIVRYILPSNVADVPTVSIQDFTLTPDTVSSNELDTTDFTFAWSTAHAVSVQISSVLPKNSLVNGSTTVSGSTFDTIAQEQDFVLTAEDSQNNRVTETVTLTVDSTVTINDFSLSSAEVAGGADIGFGWNIAGEFEKAWIEYPYEVHTPTQVVDITENVGTYTYTVPDYVWANEKIVALVVEDLSSALIRSEATMTVTCAYEWQLAVNEDDCPSNAVSVVGAYQRFERGFMIWQPRTAGDAIHVFFDDGTALSRSDSWNGQEYVIDGTPPEGLVAPENGFGYLWHTVPDIRSGLGWATTAEQSHAMTVQARFNYLPNKGPTYIYYTLPDGRLIRLDSSGGTIPTYTWISVS